MSLIVKIMSGEDLPDDDTRKSHQLLTSVVQVEFGRDPDGPVVCMWMVGGLQDEPLRIRPPGNTYVMNEAGKTISSFGHAPAPGRQANVFLDGKPVELACGPYRGAHIYEALGRYLAERPMGLYLIEGLEFRLLGRDEDGPVEVVISPDVTYAFTSGPTRRL